MIEFCQPVGNLVDMGHKMNVFIGMSMGVKGGYNSILIDYVLGNVYDNLALYFNGISNKGVQLLVSLLTRPFF